VFVKELWRYPMKSLAGEQIAKADIDELGIAGDRQIPVRNGHGRILTSRTHHLLLGLKGTLDSHAVARISGYGWDSPEALRLVKRAAGSDAELAANYCALFWNIMLLTLWIKSHSSPKTSPAEIPEALYRWIQRSSAGQKNANAVHITAKQATTKSFQITEYLHCPECEERLRVGGEDWVATTEIYTNLSPKDAIREFQARW
jgi:hypothetical protein